MKNLARFSSCLLFLMISLPVVADDSQKAQRLLNKITAMSTDPNGRRAVSLAVSQALSMSRVDLARLRHLMNINYGDLFLAYQLAKSGVNLDQIGVQMKSGATVLQIATEHHPDWKQIFADAKKINGKIDDNLLRHFANQKADAEHNADGYNPYVDSVIADDAITPDEVAEAHRRYEFLHDHAGVVANGKLDSTDERTVLTARPDPVRNGGPEATGAISQPTPR
ncbi:MAG: hypothetical protein M3O09_16615 [Acidobacteriota bacterium]|nr:hypothetical protein [Acidobacteriota bacterium]